LEQRHQGPDLAVEEPPDGLQMFRLHGPAVGDEFRLMGGIMGDLAVHHDATHGNAEILKPFQEPGNYRNGQGLGQGDEEKGRKRRRCS